MPDNMLQMSLLTPSQPDEKSRKPKKDPLAAPILRRESKPKLHPFSQALKLREEPFPDVSCLQDLRSRMAGCSLCRLSEKRTNIVFGEGNPHARLMLIGEGPGANEDLSGQPFVGAAGQLLDRILMAAGFSREEVFIGNIVKCRPPGNRLPEPDEAATCLPYLVAQIRLIAPEVIVCLGALATQTLVDPGARITRVRGTWIEKGGIKIMPTFHPAALLRDPSKKLPVWEDFQKVRDALRVIPAPAGEQVAVPVTTHPSGRPSA